MKLVDNLDINLINEYLITDPSLLVDLKKMIDYRDLRIEEAYYAKLSLLYDTKLSQVRREYPPVVETATFFDRSLWEYKTRELDASRTKYHNTALKAFYNWTQAYTKHSNLTPLIEGKPLTPEEADEHDNYRTRKETTDAMFELLHTIECPSDRTKKYSSNLQSIQEGMYQFNAEHGVKKPILKDESKDDDGGIVFDLKPQNNFDHLENL